MPHLFYQSHPKYTPSILQKQADNFFLNLRADFGSRPIFDEICVVFHDLTNKKHAILSYHSDKETTSNKNEKELSIDINHFTEKILKRGILADNEGVFDLKESGNGFDAMVRTGDIYTCFNNSKLCIDDIEADYGIPRDKLIAHIREFVSIFKES